MRKNRIWCADPCVEPSIKACNKEQLALSPRKNHLAIVKAGKEKISKYLDLAHDITAMWNVDSMIGYCSDSSFS